ncbi:MAG: response regulator [Phycisphaerae bacterium]
MYQQRSQGVMDRFRQAANVAGDLRSSKVPVDLYDTSRLRSLLTMVQQSQQEDDRAELAAASQYRPEAFEPAEAHDPEQYVAEAVSPDSSEAENAGCILVVEDEQEVREMAEAALEMQGYTVITARNGKEALSWYRQNFQQVDLVLSDVVMPGMDGQALLTEIRRINPQARAVMMSGYCSDATAAALLGKGALKFLPKPYSLEELWSTVEQALQAKHAVG